MKRASFISFLLVSILAPIIGHSTDMRVIDLLTGVNYGDRTGQTCEGMGDINGDGYNDFLTASFGLNELYLYLGDPHPFDDPPYLTWSNHGSNYGLSAFSPVNVGDMDCDGVNDFISLFGDDDSLRLYVNLDDSGAGQYYNLFIASSSSYRYNICGGGDNNGDGNAEFWVYPWLYSADDTIRGYTGCMEFDTIPDFKLIKKRDPDNQYRSLGDGFCNTCDLNGDAIPDILYAQYASLGTYPGRVCITWGGDVLSSVPDLIFYAPRNEQYWSEYGKDIACLDDISGDGIDDIWVSQGTRNYIYYGGQPFDTFPDVTIDWPHMYPDVGNVGDINNDGYNDVVLIEEDYLFSYVSYIYCYPGMDTLVDVVYMDGDFSRYPGVANICNVGMDHSWVGDVDGDDIDDILISARETDLENEDIGYLFVQAGWDSIPTGIGEGLEIPSPQILELEQNYPNPFNAGTNIEFSLPRSGMVEVRIFNLLGEFIATPLKGNLTAGTHTISWDGRDMSGGLCPSGVYFYQVKAGELSQVRRMILLK